MKIWYVLLLSICTYSLALFDYDRAVASVQRDQLPEAINVFNNLIAQQPNKADLLYDAGVAAFKHEDYAQAKAYFLESAQSEGASRQLKAQAYFNKGNTHTALNELKEALSSYQQTLLLFPEDDRAKHNYEVVKKMLEQQEQQSQQQDEQNQQDADKQDKQDNRDQKNNDQSNQDDSQQQDQSDASQKASDQNQSQDAADNNQKKEGDQGEREHEGFDQERDQQNDQQSGAEDQQDTSQNQEQRDKSGEPQQSSKQDKKEEQQNRDHESPLQDELQQQDMKDAQKEQEQAQEEELQEEQESAESVPLNPRLQQVLQKRGDRDAALNKQMIKALVNQEMKGQHGQNCW